MAKQIKKDEDIKEKIIEEVKEEVVVEKPKPFSMQAKVGWFRWPAFLQDTTFSRKWNTRWWSSAPKRSAGRWR